MNSKKSMKRQNKKTFKRTRKDNRSRETSKFTSLTQKDYKNILQYYKMEIPTNSSQLKNKAKDVIAYKLCRCIRKVTNNRTIFPSSAALGVCTKTVVSRKGFVRGDFSCMKKNRNITLKKRRKP